MNDLTQEISSQVREAARGGTPLAIRGGGTKSFYGHPLQGATVDVRPHAGIVEYEPSELVLVVRAGTALADVEGLLAGQRQMLPFEPPHFAPGATVGGCVAAGLSGPRRASAGSVRDFVLGVRMVDGQGEVLRFGGKVIKNVAGYDVSRVLAGSLGTLGVITEVSFKVLPLPAAEASIEFECSEVEALRRMNQWAGQPLPITATWYHDGRLRLRLAGASAAVASAQAKLGGSAVESGGFWHDVRDQRLPVFAAAGGRVLWRLSLPSTAPALDLPGDLAIEWGGAQRWLNSDVGTDVVRAAVDRVGGHATAFRGAADGVPLFHPLAPGVMALQRRLKATFDPAGILNPGRMYAF